ncbi:hypothetical protein ACA910_008522 [Epithemia clementina (nom. ined.)]
MLQRRSFLLVILVILSLLLTSTLSSDEYDDVVSLDDTPEDSQPAAEKAADMVEEVKETITEEAGNMQEKLKDSGAAVQEKMDEAKESAAAVVEDTNEAVTDAAKYASDSGKDAKEAGEDLTAKATSAVLGEGKEKKTSCLEKKLAFFKNLNKKKVAAYFLGAWGVSVGVGWLISSREVLKVPAMNDGVPVKSKGQ